MAIAGAQTCRPEDALARSLVVDLKKMISTTDPRVVAARDSFYHIPIVPPSSIMLVTSDSVCAAAVQALNTMYGEAKTRSVYVAKLGSGWAVIDPDDNPTGRYITVVAFDSTWTRVGGYSGP
jgi:hypothetical protein